MKVLEDDLEFSNGQKVKEMALNSGKYFHKPLTRYKKPLFTKASSTSITIPNGFSVVVNEVVNTVSDDIELSLDTNLDTGDKVTGTDYFVYAKEDGTFYISADDTIITDRLIGGFHYSLVPDGEDATGDKTEDDMVNLRGIFYNSLWDLHFRPTSSPRGKVFIQGLWYDIYLTDRDYAIRGYSAPTKITGANIAGGGTDYSRQYPKIPLAYGGDGDIDYGEYTWFEADKVVGSAGNKLIGYEAFTTIAYGVVEGARANGTYGYDDGDDKGTVTHYPEFLSKFGIEQASGNQWIWGANVGGARDEDSTSWAWRDKTGGRGKIYALHDNHIAAVRLGGQRGEEDGAAGSCCSSWSGYVWNSYWSHGSRGFCDHLELV